MLNQLDHHKAPKRMLEIPALPALKDIPPAPSAHRVDARALGRKKRAGLPLGVVIWNDVPAYDAADGKREIFRMMTGDMVRVFQDGQGPWLHVQPGLDVFLAATTKKTQPAGERFPDRDGWVNASDLHIFEPDAAKEFILEVSPVTLGNDTDFSTFAFYDRAMKNPDPVVHRVVGPRLIALVLLHEDYSSSWSALYRDRDPKIRDAALSALNARGVADNRQLIEDLIVRLTELTKTRAQGEMEPEALSILSVLKASRHPRVPQALASFKEAWVETQSERLNRELGDLLKNW